MCFYVLLNSKKLKIYFNYEVFFVFFFTFQIHGSLPLSCVSVVESLPWSTLSTFGLQTGLWQHSVYVPCLRSCCSFSGRSRLLFPLCYFWISCCVRQFFQACAAFQFRPMSTDHANLNTSCVVLLCMFMCIFFFFYYVVFMLVCTLDIYDYA